MPREHGSTQRTLRPAALNFTHVSCWPSSPVWVWGFFSLSCRCWCPTPAPPRTPSSLCQSNGTQEQTPAMGAEGHRRASGLASQGQGMSANPAPPVPLEDSIMAGSRECQDSGNSASHEARNDPENAIL